MNKQFIIFIILIFFNFARAQEKPIIGWIDNNALNISNSNQTNDINIPFDRMSEKFKNARIYGFGEASHQHKDFFNLKTKSIYYIMDYYKEDISYFKKHFKKLITETNDYQDKKYYTIVGDAIIDILGQLQFEANYSLP